jgi:heme/copper-type cytochrome/quinol oxidase subunit 3
MAENVLPFPRRAPLRRNAIGPSSVIGTLIFVVTELMLFAGFLSAFTITRAAYNTWPPIGQPRLPMEETLFNTAALLASGVVLFFANRAFLRDPQSAKKPMLLSLALGVFFVAFQGVEWFRLLKQGLSLTSSNHGAFFYLIIGTHAAHAVAAIIALALATLSLMRGKLQHSTFLAVQVFWYFVVGVWPVLYLRVYL